ncbi:MAG: hypothetical protein ACRD1E_12405 [Terriglobales bacterium]
MRKLLRPRAQGNEAVEAVLARLREHGYLDEARMAATRAAFEREVEHHGRTRALRDLRARGVGAELAQAAVAAAYGPSGDGASEDTLLRAFLRKKRVQRPQGLPQAASLYRKLLQAGFSPAASQRCLRGWGMDCEDWAMEIEEVE